MKKMARQLAETISAPPSTGPTAMLSPITPPHTPMARARSLGSMKVFVMMDIATGLSIEPPIACTARNASSQPRLGATPHSSEPSVKTTRPVWNTRRRPIRSAVEPPSVSSEARTRAYASIVHCRPEIGACRSRRIDGSAMTTIVLSSPTMNRLRQQTARTSNRRARLS
jgi:hypothetical protein